MLKQQHIYDQAVAPAALMCLAAVLGSLFTYVVHCAAATTVKPWWSAACSKLKHSVMLGFIWTLAPGQLASSYACYQSTQVVCIHSHILTPQDVLCMCTGAEKRHCYLTISCL
jgi:hypothetical protein